MTEQEKLAHAKLLIYGGKLVKHPTPYSFRWWIELGCGMGLINFDYNKGISNDFFKLFELEQYSKQTTRSYYVLIPYFLSDGF